MREADFPAFGQMLDAVCGLLSRGAYVPNAMNTALWFRALAEHDLDAVRGAFDGHVKDAQRGRFVPTPADIVAQLEGAAAADGRPGPEEAWAIAVTAADEDATVVWTDEMARAWGIARPVLAGGDKVGARMAFREAYERIVGEARQQRSAVVWLPSLGHGAAGRDAAIRQAIERGRLREADYPRLEAPAAVPLLGLAVTAAPPAAREGLARLRERMAGASRESALQWAFDLRDRELRGEELTPTQRTNWRAAIGALPLPAAPGSGFTPPPAHTLPPGMRPKPDPEAEYAAMAGAPT